MSEPGAARGQSQPPAPGRQVLVLGGTTGIGAAVAERFVLEGAGVTVAGLDSSSVPDALATKADLAELDLRDDNSVETLISRFSALDVLVNAAGILRRDEEFRPEVFSDVLTVNLTGTMRASIAARPLLVESSGCIVNVASMLSYFGGPRVPAYSASKGGIVQLTKSLAVAWGAEGIRVNAVAPGWIRTSLTRELQESPHAAEQIIRRTPMGTWGEAADVAGAVAFLAGPDAAFITGAVLPVDGGYLAT